MRRIGVSLAVWIVAVLLLWLGGGLGLRPSAVLSLIFALILDQVPASIRGGKSKAFALN